MAKHTPIAKSRTAQGLRDILFDEIEELQSGRGDPQKALAVAGLAKQIVNTVKVEMEFTRQQQQIKDLGGDVEVGTLVLGTQAPADSANARAKAH